MKGAPVATSLRQRLAFTLTEVVLAVGVLSLAIVALLGLFGPTMGSVKNVVDRSGALAVADLLNAQLLSNEVYDSVGIGQTTSSFNDLAAGLSAIKQNGTFDDKVSETALYAWKEDLSAVDGSGDVDLDQLSFKLYKDLPSSGNINRVSGSIYLIVMTKGLQKSGNDGYDFDNVSNSAYFPILVSIFEMPMQKILSGDSISPAGIANAEKPLFQYTTAKLR